MKEDFSLGSQTDSYSETPVPVLESHSQEKDPRDEPRSPSKLWLTPGEAAAIMQRARARMDARLSVLDNLQPRATYQGLDNRVD